MSSGRFSWIAVLLLSVIVGGCGADAGSTSLDAYVKKECAILVDFRDQMGQLTKEFAINIRDQAAMADTVQKIADLFRDTQLKADELGDAPNGEGTGGDEVEQAMRTLVDQLDKIANEMRAANSDQEVQAAVGRMNHAIMKAMTTAADWKKSHPTPELDRAKAAIPGCSDEPEPSG
jgi:methyl-accepting chemotaxis protein